MPPKRFNPSGTFENDPKSGGAFAQSQKDMAGLRAKHGDAKVDANRPNRDLDSFTKQPIMATIRAIRRKIRGK